MSTLIDSTLAAASKGAYSLAHSRASRVHSTPAPSAPCRTPRLSLNGKSTCSPSNSHPRATPIPPPPRLTRESLPPLLSSAPRQALTSRATNNTTGAKPAPKAKRAGANTRTASRRTTEAPCVGLPPAIDVRPPVTDPFSDYSHRAAHIHGARVAVVYPWAQCSCNVISLDAYGARVAVNDDDRRAPRTSHIAPATEAARGHQDRVRIF